MLKMALFVLLGRFAPSSDGCGRLIALLKNSSSVQGGDILDTHSDLSSDAVLFLVRYGVGGFVFRQDLSKYLIFGGDVAWRLAVLCW